MFSCLHLTSACIQVVRSSTSENGNSRLLCFDWLFQTFWHWRVLLSRWTEPENAILIIFFDEVGRAARAIRLGQWKDICTFTTIHFLYILRKGPAHIVQRPTGKTPGAPDGRPPLSGCNTNLLPGYYIKLFQPARVSFFCWTQNKIF